MVEGVIALSLKRTNGTYCLLFFVGIVSLTMMSGLVVEGFSISGAVCVVVLGICGFVILRLWRARVLLEPPSLVVRGMMRTRHLRLDDVKGAVVGSTNGNPFVAALVLLFDDRRPVTIQELAVISKPGSRRRAVLHNLASEINTAPR